MNDVTRLKKLENIRRDFVANVSHELKTPITSIKGYAETIIDGGMEDREQDKEFLNVIVRQADRLHAIVDDLLSLSRIEQETEHDQIQLVNGSLKEVLLEAFEVCEIKAVEKQISLELDCPDDVQVPMDGPLLEQAVVNLLVNAIKYSHEGGRVAVTVSHGEAEDQGTVALSVRDFGVGIEQKHLPRLFERFYRSDKARSRKLGGTGLGLAIVKHIAQVHNGTVTVESELGEGTVFTILLPFSQQSFSQKHFESGHTIIKTDDKG
jgi:two-component system phosphate regulon sensor histidine kinase PhoR